MIRADDNTALLQRNDLDKTSDISTHNKFQFIRSVGSTVTHRVSLNGLFVAFDTDERVLIGLRSFAPGGHIKTKLNLVL